MGFSRKRGRPALQKSQDDKGTNELQRKKSLGITAEPLDLCLKKGLICDEEHNAGIRLRWLYTLRFGAPDISAYSLDRRGKSCVQSDNDEWLHPRQLEYNNALTTLDKIGAKTIVMNICVFNQRPAFLLPYSVNITSMETKSRHAKFTKFKDGLKALAKDGRR
jgi:hypothetical protein